MGITQSYNSKKHFVVIKELATGEFGRTCQRVRNKSDLELYVLESVNLTNLFDLQDVWKQILAIQPLHSFAASITKELEQIKHDKPEHIVQCISAFEETIMGDSLLEHVDWCCIVWENCTGGSLNEAIEVAARKNELFTDLQLRIWSSQLTAAVEYLHKNKILHRDISSKHVLLTYGHNAKLGGLGLKRHLKIYDEQRLQNDTNFDHRLPLLQTRTDAPQQNHIHRNLNLFSAPELFNGSLYDEKCDIWSLGVTLYHAARLSLPFNSLNDICRRAPDGLTSEFSNEVDGLIFSMLEKYPFQRPSAATLASKSFLNCPEVKQASEDNANVEASNEGLKFEELIGKLYFAATIGNLDELKRVSTTTSDKIKVLQYTDCLGNDLLHHAIVNEHFEVVEYLVSDLGANIESRDSNGRTPFLLACGVICGIEVVRLLVEKGADVEAVDARAWKGIHVAASFGDCAIINYLIDLKPEWISERHAPLGATPLHHAAASGRTMNVKFLIEKKFAPIDEEDEDQGSKAIHLAATFGNVWTVNYLLSIKPQWLEERSRKYGRTPLLHAAMSGNLPVVKFLVKQKAKLDIEDTDQGSLPIHLAGPFGNVATCDFLLEQRPWWLEARSSKYGRTPLMHAAAGGNLAVVQYLLSKGADVNAIDVDSERTALQLALLFNHTAVVEYLTLVNLN